MILSHSVVLLHESVFLSLEDNYRDHSQGRGMWGDDIQEKYITFSVCVCVCVLNPGSVNLNDTYIYTYIHTYIYMNVLSLHVTEV